MNEKVDGRTMTAILTTRSRSAWRIVQRWPIGQGSSAHDRPAQSRSKPVMHVNDKKNRPANRAVSMTANTAT
ncbi:hypothetical protein [Burkholderia sp. Bp9031]|uniref:hypothetical protein n=1 Tax=Burkholderia sp. Bp9031 TaxID=2184566 RepID=UPI000F5E8AC8|nr:hypothetical protein [Burkholderia sp. Bp9031]